MSAKQDALQPIEQKSILFGGQSIMAVRVEDDTVYVPIRPICDALGINWSGQRQRIRRDPVLSDVMRFVCVTHPNLKGGNPNVLALPLEFLNGWLLGINANRVKEEIREPLIQYQKYLYKLLADAFDPAFVQKGKLRRYYRGLGRPEAWINTRLKAIDVRNDLTNEWQERGITQEEYAILTNTISEGAFDISVEGHRQLKNLEASDSLRDNMTRMELIINMLGEETTATIANTEDAQGFTENQEAAEKGGKAAGTARKAVELETGQPVLSSDNYLPKQKQPKLLDDV